MRGKVKYVKRDVWYSENLSNHWSPAAHPVRHTKTYAFLDNGDEVDIDEDDIRSHYDCSRITSYRISRLSDDLHDKWIEYSMGDDGNYCLDGELSDYI